MAGKNDQILTVANLLSLYRLAAAPVAAWMALAGYREAFFVLIVISLATDLVDGAIARSLGQGSGPGARLDSIADACTVLAAILGIFVFEGDNIRPELPWLYLFLASYAAATVTSLAKLGVLPAYHLYLSKAAAFCAGVFFVWLFMFGYSRPVFLAVVGLGVLANVESLLVTLVLKRFRSDLGSLFWVQVRARDDAEGDGGDSH